MIDDDLMRSCKMDRKKKDIKTTTLFLDCNIPPGLFDNWIWAIMLWIYNQEFHAKLNEIDC